MTAHPLGAAATQWWEAKVQALEEENARLREALRCFAVDDTEFIDDHEGGEPSDDITLYLSRSRAAELRELCGASDEKSNNG